MAIEAAAWWRAFYQFRFANWLRELVSVLRGPGAASDQFPLLSKTRIDAKFQSFCEKQFIVMVPALGASHPPIHAIQAQKTVVKAIQSQSGKPISALCDLMGDLEKEIVPLLEELIKVNEAEMQALTTGSVDDLLAELGSIGKCAPNKSRTIVFGIKTRLQEARQLPRSHGPSPLSGDSSDIADAPNTNEPNSEGYVRIPAHPGDYVPVSKIVLEHTPLDLGIGPRQMDKYLGDFATHGIRWTRPIGKNGEPQKRRRSVHLGDWHSFLERGGPDGGSSDPTPDDIERRKAAIRGR